MQIRWNVGLLFLCAVSVGTALAGTTPSTPTDSLTASIRAAGDSTAWAGADAVVVIDRTDVRVEDTGLGHVRHNRVVRVLTEAGARRLATQRFDYDPASNYIRLDRVRIIRADGRIESIDPTEAIDLPAPAQMIYWGARMKVLSLPRLEIGDAVETGTYKKGFQIAYLADDRDDDERYVPPMRGHFYDVVTFQEGLPLKEKIYRLRVPRDKPVQYAVYNGALRSSLTFADSALVYTWEARDVPALKGEPRMPDDTDVLPKVVLATVENWPAKSRWFFEINDPVFAADDGIRAKVRELTRGLETDDEKMAALLHWVAQEIRYSGLSMGKGEGYTLHPGTMTFEERCGVCKDIAGMLVTMLRAAGYTTYPVMTDAGARVEAIPADQFNHCVVAVERPDGSFTMLDPTWAPFDRSTWSHYEGEQNFVIGSPRGEGLSRIRTFTPAENRLSIENKAALAPDGTIEGEMVLRGIGASDARLRGGLADAPADDRRAYLADLLSDLGPGVEVTAYEVVEPRDFGRDARIRISYRVPRYAVACDTLIGVVPPALRLAAKNGRLVRMLALTKSEGEREHEALLWFSQEVTARDTIQLPSGFRAMGAPDSVSITKDAGSFRGRAIPDGGKLRTEATAVLAKRTIPAAEWDGGAEAADSLRAFGGRIMWAGRER
jgi:hypothetical protein